MNETHVTLVGTVVTDPFRRHGSEGAPYIKFRMVSNERRKDRVTQEWVAGDSLFVNVTCWRRLVKGVGAAIGKGDPVIVVGRLDTREWMEEGQRRSSLELDASAVGPDLARCVAMIDHGRKFAAPAGEGLPGDAAEGAGELLDGLTVDVPDDAAALGEGLGLSRVSAA
ncbi:MAG: single-stranded DNA-binding protein [Mycobacteriaceae bacterium]